MTEDTASRAVSVAIGTLLSSGGRTDAVAKSHSTPRWTSLSERDEGRLFHIDAQSQRNTKTDERSCCFCYGVVVTREKQPVIQVLKDRQIEGVAHVSLQGETHFREDLRKRTQTERTAYIAEPLRADLEGEEASEVAVDGNVVVRITPVHTGSPRVVLDRLADDRRRVHGESLYTCKKGV